MNDKFLDFYYTLTGKEETNIKNLIKPENREIIGEIIDLILMEKGVIIVF